MAGLVTIGLGYLYVGRARFAPVPILFVVFVYAVAGWSRLILEPSAVYWVYVLTILTWLVSIIHPALVAYKTDDLPKQAYNKTWIYLIWILVVQLALGEIVQRRESLFGFGSYQIKSSSMSPTLEKGDWILVDTWCYRNSVPQINEVVIHELSHRQGSFAFRVVGLPGTTIEIRSDNLFRDGVPVEEAFIEIVGPRRSTALVSDFGPFVVPKNQYFVLGDNRLNSRDSRYLGAIQKDQLRGRVAYRWFAYDDGIRWSRFPSNVGSGLTSESCTRKVP